MLLFDIKNRASAYAEALTKLSFFLVLILYAKSDELSTLFLVNLYINYVVNIKGLTQASLMRKGSCRRSD